MNEIKIVVYVLYAVCVMYMSVRVCVFEYGLWQSPCLPWLPAPEMESTRFAWHRLQQQQQRQRSQSPSPVRVCSREQQSSMVHFPFVYAYCLASASSTVASTSPLSLSLSRSTGTMSSLAQSPNWCLLPFIRFRCRVYATGKQTRSGL